MSLSKKEALERLNLLYKANKEIYEELPNPYSIGLLAGLDLAIILLKDEEDEQ